MPTKISFLAMGILCFSGYPASAASQLGAGFWANYAYIHGNDTDEETWGAIKDEALILYADGAAEAGKANWLYSAELRIGPGSFTDTANNSTGDRIVLHKAWVSFKLTDSRTLQVGKSQVPFGWKTTNFWPGDVLLAGYGDQMDVGFKLSNDQPKWHYDAAYYHADDWGESSTDTVDDNGHWGSSSTFRKVQTLVGNIEHRFNQSHKIALAAQAGRLQDLTGLSADNEVDGQHQAWVVSYYGDFGAFATQASFIDGNRKLPANHVIQKSLPAKIANQRYAAEISYRKENWFFYVDASWARPDTQSNRSGVVHAIAPGFSYDYGPGWVYVELLTQNGFVDRNGQVNEGDFDALYISLDLYL